MAKVLVATNTVISAEKGKLIKTRDKQSLCHFSSVMFLLVAFFTPFYFSFKI